MTARVQSMMAASESEMSNLWTEEKEAQLCEMWQSKPCLYVTSSRAYSNRNATAAAKADICQELSVSGESILCLELLI